MGHDQKLLVCLKKVRQEKHHSALLPQPPKREVDSKCLSLAELAGQFTECGREQHRADEHEQHDQGKDIKCTHFRFLQFDIDLFTHFVFFRWQMRALPRDLTQV